MLGARRRACQETGSVEFLRRTPIDAWSTAAAAGAIWGSLMAACLVTSIPIAILYNLFLERFIAGLTVGAVK